MSSGGTFGDFHCNDIMASTQLVRGSATVSGAGDRLRRSHPVPGASVSSPMMDALFTVFESVCGSTRGFRCRTRARNK
jgi:hypothetical protein